MGKLFWKFFLFLWLAQLFTVIGVSAAIWYTELDRNSPGSRPPNVMPGANGPPMFQQPPPLPSDFGMGSPPPPPPVDFGESGVPPGPLGEPPSDMPGRSISPPLLPLFAGSLVSLLFAALLARYFARPIRSLSEAFERVARGKMDTRIGESMGRRHDELADLGSGFDSMADRLQGLVEDKQRLLHDVSHELRSPLARLQAAIDLMQQQPERANEFMTRIERESVHIDRLVGELLTFARLDSGIPGDQMLEFDLVEMIKVIAEDASFEAETKKCNVNTTVPKKVFMNGNPDLLHRAIENIVRNAVRHTQEGSSITIQGEFSSDKRWLILSISDKGDGVAESDLKLIFEPFYRSPTADRFKGYGIGMAITQRVVDAHDGKVSAKNHKEGGLVVTMELPLKHSTSHS